MMYMLFFPLKGRGLESFFGEARYDVLQIFLQNPIQNPACSQTGGESTRGREGRAVTKLQPSPGVVAPGVVVHANLFYKPFFLGSRGKGAANPVSDGLPGTV